MASSTVTAVRLAGPLPDDAGDGNASDASLPDSPDGRAQITRFSVALGDHLGYRAAAHR
jgi:hypothetical protein